MTQLNRAPTFSPNAALTNAVVRWVHRSKPCKAELIGVFAKGITAKSRNPAWMMLPVFGGLKWVELGVHERKYFVRMTIAHLVDSGVLRVLTQESRLKNQRLKRFEVASLLDAIAAARLRLSGSRGSIRIRVGISSPTRSAISCSRHPSSARMVRAMRTTSRILATEWAGSLAIRRMGSRLSTHTTSTPSSASTSSPKP